MLGLAGVQFNQAYIRSRADMLALLATGKLPFGQVPLLEHAPAGGEPVLMTRSHSMVRTRAAKRTRRMHRVPMTMMSRSDAMTSLS